VTQEQKIIRAKLGLLELAKQLGNVSQACKMMGYRRDSFYRFQIGRSSAYRCASCARRNSGLAGAATRDGELPA